MNCQIHHSFNEKQYKIIQDSPEKNKSIKKDIKGKRNAESRGKTQVEIKEQRK